MLTSMTALNTIKILQGSVVTQTMLGGLSMYPEVANFLLCAGAKDYESLLTVDILHNKSAYFFGPPYALLFLFY